MGKTVSIYLTRDAVETAISSAKKAGDEYLVVKVLVRDVQQMAFMECGGFFPMGIIGHERHDFEPMTMTTAEELNEQFSSTAAKMRRDKMT